MMADGRHAARSAGSVRSMVPIMMYILALQITNICERMCRKYRTSLRDDATSTAAITPRNRIQLAE